MQDGVNILTKKSKIYKDGHDCERFIRIANKKLEKPLPIFQDAWSVTKLL